MEELLDASFALWFVKYQGSRILFLPRTYCYCDSTILCPIEVVYENVKLIQLVQNKVQWLALTDHVMSIWVP
jgi:hypothetical protein